MGFTVRDAKSFISALGGKFKALVFEQFVEGVTLDPATTATDINSAPVLAEMTFSFTPKSLDHDIEIVFGGAFQTTGKGDNGARVAVSHNGTPQPKTERRVYTIDDPEYQGFLTTFWRGKPTAGVNTLSIIFWGTDDCEAIGDLRGIIVREIEPGE
ncbi:MAG: hypothetical protein JRJ68_03250 [Deltaproteobacteria bacterium]|nr:hypothetical protein [Deltaproteobacteria bacterium]